ncbi:hypothetical protein GCM10011506_40790 [Marivirga lumbricoides]|uniref:Peptidase M28 domain-containing protein n=1 Tax=Marivirga lumbricoides TaxID=1046115 RepID=A0ABQ1N0Z3_9BACT|nr:hypothetical protein GCM10011506_40790 [Marivirga lumbricoides]
MRIILTIILASLTIHAFSQDKKAKQIIEVLASDSLAGRGYVAKGQEKAAQFISNKLFSYGISSTRQTLSYPVNTFPKEIMLAAKEKKSENLYQPGSDFLIHPASGSISLKNQEVNALDSFTSLEKVKSGKVYSIKKTAENAAAVNELVNNFLKSKNFKKSLLLVLDSGKLTWFPANFQSKNAVVYLRAELKENSITAKWQTQFEEQFSSSNIFAKVSGSRSDSMILFTAHYDHLGKMGDEAIFPGAHDNASGVAMLITLAEHFADNPPKFDTYFLFTTAEEIGLLGSYFFVQNPLVDLRKIKLLINLDLLGTGEEGIMVVNAKKHSKVFEKLKALKPESIPEIKARGEACNSDHCLFDQAGVPAIFIYTLGGRQAYHDIDDTAEGLSLYGYNSIQKLVIEFLQQF